MSKIHIFVVTIICLMISSTIHAKGEYSFWIRVIDQNNEPIEQAIVYYCIIDCTLYRNSQNKKQTLTNNQGYAQLKLKARDSLQIQGIKKGGYDVRLQTMPYNTIRLTRPDKNPKTFHHRSAIQGINIRFEDHKQAYSSTVSEPIAILTGWKLGEASCLEQDHEFIFHDGRAANNWEINNKEYYYLIGDDNNTLRKGNMDHFDFKVSIDRSHYPWGSIINRLITTYKVVIDFKNGGGREIKSAEYLHQAPSNGYNKQIKIQYRGIGDVATSHIKKYFIKINNRYGAVSIRLVPTEQVMFEYLLNRKVGSKSLNIPSFIGERGETDDYFTCGSSASVFKPKTTEPGACANLGRQKTGC